MGSEMFWAEGTHLIGEVAQAIGHGGMVMYCGRVADLGVAEAFVAAEEEELVLEDGTAHGAAIGVLVLARLFRNTGSRVGTLEK